MLHAQPQTGAVSARLGVVARLGRAITTMDPCLAATLVAAALFCFYGMGWGRVECWNRDQMALRDLRGLRPHGFTKPPFHTYLNHAFVLAPLQGVEAIASLASGTKQHFNEARLIGSRLLVMALFLGTICLGYVVAERFYGRFAARVVALFFGTSAGFIAYAHFLSCDSPLLFFLLAAFYFAQRIIQRGETRDYVWAGLLTGLAAATKYNGLAIGIVIPVAHLMSANCRSLRSCLLSSRLILGLALVPAGFLLGNPYAVITPRKFIEDFMYNYTVTPAYSGQTGHGYLEFLRRFPEVLGMPGTFAVAALVLASLCVVAVRRGHRRVALQGLLLTASFALLYYLKIGAFARMPTRFVLPVIPFVILMAGPFLQAIESRRRWVYALLAPVLLYNAVCSALVAKRFTDDPRLGAQDWLIAHLPRGKILESSTGSPHWAKMLQLDLVELKADKPTWAKIRRGETADLRMPGVNGRSDLFGRIFAGNRWVEERRLREGSPNQQLFTLAELMKRNPDYIAVYSSDRRAPSDIVQAYYNDLLEGRFPYSVSYDGESPPASRFAYPREIDFLDGRMTILERRAPAVAAD